jgi:hypothetical protein
MHSRLTSTRTQYEVLDVPPLERAIGSGIDDWWRLIEGRPIPKSDVNGWARLPRVGGACPLRGTYVLSWASMCIN